MGCCGIQLVAKRVRQAWAIVRNQRIDARKARGNVQQAATTATRCKESLISLRFAMLPPKSPSTFPPCPSPVNWIERISERVREAVSGLRRSLGFHGVQRGREGRSFLRPDSRLAGVATRAALPKRRRQQRRTKHEEEEKREEKCFMPQYRLKSGRKHETWSRA